MPHVKFDGDLDLESAWHRPPAFDFSVPEEDLHVKFEEAYLSGRGTSLLYRYVVSEGRLTQRLGLLLARDGEGWILKLDKAAPVLRTPGVKLLLAAVAAWAQGLGLRKTASTVEAFEGRGAFYALHHPPFPSTQE
ncbi:MAG: hypothetical protein ACP5VN_04965 [Acidobacteriota bacterium]